LRAACCETRILFLAPVRLIRSLPLAHPSGFVYVARLSA
jgi:hypothetical protein